ncbi:hypothetical protein T4B_2739 [Trichinella pseudospiralis]|uniref:PiggyBac transposable element-derived protein domain-containing protein n=1 Tax=Trichinella pseudospiralis TaxID=6337 RepID=A0A0V1JHE1_TRIPS|nr:hypothetical protein T4B_2739 [Trichinella pseudospiralis]
MQLVRPNIECRASCMQKNIQRCILMVLVEDQVLKNTRNEETSSRKKFRCALCIARGDKKILNQIAAVLITRATQINNNTINRFAKPFRGDLALRQGVKMYKLRDKSFSSECLIVH